MLTLAEYGEKMLHFDRSPGTIWYYGLGLAGEAGELTDKIKKVYRDKLDPSSEAIRAAIKSELGDVLWYTTRLADFFGHSLDQLNQELPCPTAHFELWYPALRLSGAAGRVADHIADREDIADRWQGARPILASLRLALVNIKILAAQFGWSLEDIAEANLAKLSSREQRGVLHGEGDTR